ncbi:haloacid dehalogenase [Rhodotorula toruloides]|uniref:Haloacid dehalogenase n=1 Tax=Rhodotorula toruloides TaxID=5286 RepID=A0A511KIH2_RHOTO|nr:haloacid dehalogenase [Rhodotorula toruloides]
MVSRTPIAFDVLGTCFSLDPAKEALRDVFKTVSDAQAESVIQDWFHSAQRDFTYLSMNGSYTPIGQVLKSTLPRILLMHSLVPASSASPSTTLSTFDSSLTDHIISTLTAMRPRPSLSPCSDLLLSHDFCLLAATNGALETTRGLFEKGLGKDVADRWEYFSTDEARVAKPDPSVYVNIWKKLGVEEGAEKEGWFIAAHTWDLFPAKKAGFKTVFVTYEEHLVLPDLFGEPDIVAKDLEDAAKQIIEREGAQA